MANEYKNLPVLPEVKIGSEVYYLKDADVRALLDTYGNAVKYSVDTTFDASKENLATSKAIAAYLEGKIAVVKGVRKLSGATVEATDLRGGAALVSAALMADGISTVSGIMYIKRGYENLVEKLTILGAKIREEW